MPLNPSPAVVRAGDLLALMAERPTRPFSASELARLADIPRATCNSVLLGLAANGLVRRDAELRYELGPACIVLGDAARVANPALRAAALQAEALARAQSAVVAVSMREGAETRVAHVFDFGPPFGIRPRAGDFIDLVPPFGASFVAWDDAQGVEDWLGRVDPPLTAGERERYLTALAAVRRRGYSISVASDRQAELAAAFDRHSRQPDLDDARTTRDRAIREIAHGDYLAAEVEPGDEARLTQISAPVFEPGGAAAASIMLLGPDHELTAGQITGLGQLVREAADRATADAGGTPRRGDR
jgi:DNA-binding IclR family transcriptional regulator